MSLDPLDPPLPDEVLARRAALPRKPAPIELVGARLRLRPLDLAADLDGLHAVSCGAPIQVGGRAVAGYDPEERIWRFMSAGPFADAAGLGAWLGAHHDAPDGAPLTVLDLATDYPVGVVNYMANVPEHLKIELGGIWYGPVVQGSGVNLEATYLLLRHAFALGYRRVEWKAHAANQRSRRAALRMGFAFEGVQDAHYIIKGRNRDTAWYRMLDRDWPTVEPTLRARAGL